MCTKWYLSVLVYPVNQVSLLMKYFVLIILQPQAKDRICKLIQSGVDSGAKLLLDGRNIVVCFHI